MTSRNFFPEGCNCTTAKCARSYTKSKNWQSLEFGFASQNRWYIQIKAPKCSVYQIIIETELISLHESTKAQNSSDSQCLDFECARITFNATHAQTLQN